MVVTGTRESEAETVQVMTGKVNSWHLMIQRLVFKECRKRCIKSSTYVILRAL